MAGIDLNDADESIINTLREGRNTPSILARELDYSREYVSQRLRRLREHDIVARVDRGLYELVEENAPAVGDEDGQQRREEPTTPPSETSPVDREERRETNVEDALDAVDFPGGREREECVEAVRAAYEYLQREGSGTMREFVREVMPEHPVGYDVPDLEPGERYRGAWWRKVVKPGLAAIPDVESPPRGASDWTLSE
ncbi:winged helix-turn-helix domain-containing protein [Haloarcula sp. Atlit-7R]|uniref:winged helix-turn-helix domain-containing protein n=1 Tax=Haloarcula sp. Atlit-7R TaxID=2282125 RepID=UPI000EF15F0E|nr:winged helix-turn-helix transcriptional regulator [Haloarcula sp. Atlit-7R]RLM87896.1 winged helix-turn-helix transcriptional regulator [Haloarcula sp. Atlit-7R]